MCKKFHVIVFYAVFILFFAALASGGTNDFSFTLNGKPIKPYCHSLRSLGIGSDLLNVIT
jgi:hypothetical protein